MEVTNENGNQNDLPYDDPAFKGAWKIYKKLIISFIPGTSLRNQTPFPETSAPISMRPNPEHWIQQ
jgi:hypothetical protein